MACDCELPVSLHLNVKQTNLARVQETLRETNSTSSKCLCKRRRLSKYQTGYGQIRYLMKRLNTVLSNKLQESKPSRFYSVRNTEKLQQEQKKGRLTNPSHRSKQQRFLQKKKERMMTSKSLQTETEREGLTANCRMCRCVLVKTPKYGCTSYK